MLELLMISSFVILGLYTIWYFFKAETYVPINIDDLALMWKNHKQQTGCKASNIQTLLLKKNEVVGYKCSCGKNYYQKRLITQRAHNFAKSNLIPNFTTRFTGIADITNAMNQVGLSCSHIKQI